jgi:hypothetical protein
VPIEVRLVYYLFLAGRRNNLVNIKGQFMRKTAILGLVWLAVLSAGFAARPRVGSSRSGPHSSDKSLDPPEAHQPGLVTTNTITSLYLPLALKSFNPADTQPYGIVMYNAIDASAGLNQMQAAGARRVTTYVRWSDVQASQTSPYDWSLYDAKLTNATNAGMSILVLFDGNPTWVSPVSDGPVPAIFMPDLINVVTAMVQRYNGTAGLPRIDYWSFYGEPDNQYAWGNFGADYAGMLVQIAPIVHAANPYAKVVLGGLAYDRFTDDNPPGDWVRTFLPDVLQELLNHAPGFASYYIDVMAFNYYPISLQRWPTIKDKAAAIRTVLAQYGVGQLPLFVTEMSIWSIWANGENQPVQAENLVYYYVRGQSVGIQQLYWFQVFDVVPSIPGGAQGLFRVTDLNDPKQSYFAYMTLTNELGGLQFSRTLNLSGGEGYVFGAGANQKTVVWGQQQAATTLVDFAQACAQRVDMLGVTSQIVDGGPGDLDGFQNGNIRLGVGFDPIYVGLC